MDKSVVTNLCTYYLKKHSIPEDQFGMGPFLEHESFELFAAGPAFPGSLILKPHRRSLYACRVVAENLRDDISANHPYLQPVVMCYHNHGSHYWVSVTDPVSNEKIAIDATPWFYSVEKERKGMVFAINNKLESILITKRFGKPFSVKKYGDHFISVYIEGYLPRLVQKLPGEQVNSDVFPEYRFKLIAVQEKYFGAPAEKMLTFFVHINDSSLLLNAFERIKNFDELLSLKILQVGLSYPDMKKKEFSSNTFFPSLSAIRTAAEKENSADLFKEVEKNIPRFLILLKKVKCLLPVYAQPTKHADVKNGVYLSLTLLAFFDKIQQMAEQVDITQLAILLNVAF